MLICQSATQSMRVGGFQCANEPLDEGGWRKARALKLRPKLQAIVLTSPALAARQTAQALGLEAQPDEGLGDLDHGLWTGRTFEAVGAEAPQALAAWIADPASAAPGGEPFAALQDRAAAFLSTHKTSARPVLGVTHPMTMRALLAAALGMPPSVTFRIDLPPLSVIKLVWSGAWRLRTIQPGARLD